MNKPKLNQRTQQDALLSPQQLIKANILQLNSMMLEARLYQELESNPALEIIEPEVILDSTSGSEEQDEHEENFDDEENQDWVTKPDKIDNSNMLSNLKNQSTITEQVMLALQDDNLSDNELTISEHIVGNLDEQGYLSIDSELISDKLNVSNQSVLNVLEKIKHSKFPGLGSSNIRECLLAQLEVYNISDIGRKIIHDYFDDFMNKRYEKIMKNINCDKDQLQDAITIISQLNPNPRSMIDETDYKKNTIIPDLILEQINNNWNIIINDTSCPDLLISDNYLKMSKDKNQSKDVKIFLKSKIQSAEWLIEAVQSRNQTIQKIMACIIKRQSTYFDVNQKDLKPMILKDVAEELGMDISTISRATKEKYVQMPWGIKELKFFFSEGIASDKGEISSKNVKQRLKEIIDSEDKAKPFGDSELTDILKSEGIVIARRTISKYREELNYQTARLRKELK
jgi:RNA polymerase sigma-54 factor|tara:strand:- start:44 stop:1411 length:1368 start_codon:yes stop_codon:yes gene_type:complete